ncbi:MAG: hypothetical protein OXR84_06150 [Magnetovibrio sp.]|nr:hypothetical protein [Magnetovibrio sp.]
MSKTRRLWLRIVGWGFVGLGVLGLFLPILQGVLFLLVGLCILSTVSPRARLFRQGLRRRYPSLAGGIDQAEAWLKRQSMRVFGRRESRPPAGRAKQAHGGDETHS